ncbi:hypothetical protein ACFUJ0_10555 [Streptomyces sp. NPDC057242]|uniref:hypothetical protein n=1 Tax=unclassified Streptomyces TaxID=2593676 RepID=UPI0036328BB8
MTFHDAAAHLVDTVRTIRLGLLADLARSGFDFDQHNGMKYERGTTLEKTLRRLERTAPRTSTPPGLLNSRLVKEVVHDEDIRRPLGLTHTYQHEIVARALRPQTRIPAAFGGARERLTRERLIARDTGFTTGTGPSVTGPALSLLLAVGGRRSALVGLTVPGLDALA